MNQISSVTEVVTAEVSNPISSAETMESVGNEDRITEDGSQRVLEDGVTVELVDR